MAKFDKYLWSQLFVMFGFFALVLVLVFWINQAVILFDQLIANGQSATIFLEFSALTLPTVIRNAMPIAAFAASVYVGNRLASDSELVVMQTTGYSPFRLARPILIFGLLVALMMSALTHYLVPASLTELKIRRAEIASSATTRLLREGQFLHPTRGLTFYVSRIDRNGALQDIFLWDSRQPDRQTTYTARRALLIQDQGTSKLVMLDGMAQVLRTQDQNLATTSFSDFVFDIGALLSSRVQHDKTPGELPTAKLLWPDETLRAKKRFDPALYKQTAHQRFAEPLLTVVVALIGFSAILMGGFSRFSLWKQVLFAILILIALKSLDNVMVATARRDENLWPLVYLSSVLGLVTAAIMLYLSDRPSLHPAAWRRRAT